MCEYILVLRPTVSTLLLHVLALGLTVFEWSEKREADKRKRQRNSDASDVDGYLGPWGKFVDEKTTLKPSEVHAVFLSHFWYGLS